MNPWVAAEKGQAAGATTGTPVMEGTAMTELAPGTELTRPSAISERIVARSIVFCCGVAGPLGESE
jgi:hypothetical protein